MKEMISFILGVLLYWFVTGFTHNTIKDQLSEVWNTAYQAGKDDGYTLGRSEFSYMKTPEWLESKCMFLYDSEGNVNVR